MGDQPAVPFEATPWGYGRTLGIGISVSGASSTASEDTLMNVSCQFAIYPLGAADVVPPLRDAMEAVERRGLVPVVRPILSTITGELGQVTGTLRDAFRSAAGGDRARRDHLDRCAK